MKAIDWFAAIAAYGLLLTLAGFMLFGLWKPLAVAMIYTAVCCWAFGNCPQERAPNTNMETPR